jgi:hypothetical protein
LSPRDPAGPPANALSRERIGAQVVRVLEAGSRRDPVVSLVSDGERSFVVKDFKPRGWLVRGILGPFLVWRELRAYRALAGHPDVPRLIGRIDARAFAVEYRPGQKMSRRLAGTLPADFLPRLEKAIREMHARGVAHLDLRHRSNVLADAAGRPVLIDFASALCFRPGSLAARWLLPLFAWFDLRALEKWSARLGAAAPARAQEEAGGGGAGGASDGGRGASRPT